jgi:hypothetical protein
MGSYARASGHMRDKADFKVSKAAALVELGELIFMLRWAELITQSIPPINSCLPIRTMSVCPYLFVGGRMGADEVVNKVKQMKPFLLLVVGIHSEEDEQPKPEPVESNGRLFQHDPALRLKTTYGHQPLRIVRHFPMSTLSLTIRQCLNNWSKSLS